MKLNRSKPFGKISGEMFIPDGCDRPAFFEQDGKFFDAHDRLIEPGVSVADADDGDDDAMPDGFSVADLLREAEAMSLRKLKTAATVVLGPACPAGKTAIIDALRNAQAEFDARAAKRQKPRAPAEIEKAADPAEVAAPVNGVDLAAWARGQREYLWAEVRKAIKTKYGRNVGERDDAVEFLISQGLVSAESARKDVLREATA